MVGERAPQAFQAMAAVFVTPDLRACVDFYAEKLGFSCDVDWAVKPTFAIVERGPVSIMFKEGVAAPPPLRTMTPGLDLFDVYVWVKDIREIEKDLRAHAAPIVAGPVERAYGCTEIVARDPDGRFVAFGFCP